MRFLKKLMLSVLSILFLANCVKAKKSYSMGYVNGIAAIVEDQIITVDELNREIFPFLQQASRESRNQQVFDSKIEQLKRQALENLIDQVIVIKEFNSRKGFIPQTALDNSYNHYIKTNFQGERERFWESLRVQGRTDRQFKEMQKKELILQVFRNQMLKSHPEISPARINKFYKDNESMFYQENAIHLRQITLIPESNEQPEDLIARANKVIDKLKAGDEFIDVAKEESKDDRRKAGGDWGWINRSEIHEKLAKVAFDLDKHTFSDPVLFNDNIFIMYIEDIRPEGPLPLETVHDQIEQILSTELTRKAQVQRLDRFRKKAYVKYFI